MNHNGTRSYQFQVSYHLFLVLSSGFFPSFLPTRTYNSVCLSHILTTYPVSLIYPGCSSSCRRSETISLNCDHQRAYFSSPRWYMMWESRWMIFTCKPKNCENNLSQCQFVHHKSHMDWPGRYQSLRGVRPKINHPNHGHDPSIRFNISRWTLYIL
jgi:hypothetical protein